jgi:steroid delta-isomerase-like uncharacterized protein
MDIAAAHREILEGAWSGGSTAIVDELYASDYVFVGPLVPEGMHGPEGEKALIASYRESFPDLKFTVHEQLVDGEKVATRWTAVGTQLGELAGIPPTGRTGEAVGGVSIARFSDGKLQSAWTMWDVHGLLVQLGVVPAPREPAAV